MQGTGFRLQQAMRFLQSIQGKLFVAFLTVVLIPLIGTGLYGNWITSRIIEERVIESARSNVEQHAQQIAGFLDSVRGDVLYLAHLDSLQRLLQARAQGDDEGVAYWRTQLARDFLIFSAARPTYYQVRYLDETGREVVRVDSDGRVSRIIPQDKLQDKSHRYYFQETIQRGPGEIYVSPLDLNREHGQIEVPYRPVIRYATPIYVDSTLRGIVIINVYADYFLRFLYEHGPQKGMLLMVDQDGYYLAHPDPTRRWGGPVDLNTGYGLWTDYPDAASQILSGQEGTYISGDQAIVYTPLYPVAVERDRFWVILRVESTSSLFAPIRAFRVTAASILAAAILVATAMTMVLARQLTEPIRALQRGVEQFGQGKLDHPLEVKQEDEIGQLTHAFNQMAAAIRRYVVQLEMLNEAGQRISSGLDRQATVRAIADAARQLLPAEFVAILCLEQSEPHRFRVLVEVGDRRWATLRETPAVQTLYQEALNLEIGQSRNLQEAGGFVCCAPLRIEANRRSLIELYGADPELGDPWASKLLSTLAAHASIALENVSLYEVLAEHRQRLAHLVEDLINAQEEERKLVAYDLHDGLIQYLVGARMHLRSFTALRDTNPQAAEEALEAGMAHLATAISEGRRVIEGLRPTLLDDMGLAAAIGELTRQMAMAAGWEVELDLATANRQFPPSVEITAFRIVQEALTNARKYAQARRVKVSLAVRDSVLEVVVQDWGRGFDPEATRNRQECMGLVGMRERAHLVGGRCTIHSEPGKGTRVLVRLPLQSESGVIHEPLLGDEADPSADCG